MAHDHDDLFRMLRMMGVPVPENDSDDDAIPVDAVIGDAEDSADGGSTHDGSDDRHGGKHKKAKRGSSAHTGNEFFDSLARWSKRAFIVAAIVLIVALAASYWWFHPALNLQSPQVWSWIILIAVVVAVALKILSLRSLAHGALFRRLIAVPIAVIIAFVVGVVAGFPFIPGNAERYATVLETTDGTFSEDIEEVDYSEVPVIDHASAVLLGDRAMGSIPEYVSQFEISSAYSQINYHGRPVRVSPLTYADLFKWFSNRNTGIPAYVLVDMVTQEAEVVRLDEPIKYSESEPLARNIDRYVQLKYPTYMFDQKSFELDEDGTPWWVFPVQRRTIGLFQGTTIQRVVLVNACTGETEDYAVEDVPTWVDRAYPSDLIIQQYNWSGMYANGWLNSWLGQRDVVRTTSGHERRAGLQLLGAGRGHLPVLGRVERHGGQLEHRLHFGEPAHGRITFLPGSRCHGGLRHGKRRGRAAEPTLSGNVPAAVERGWPAHVLHVHEGRRGPGEDVCHDQRRALSKRGDGRHGGGVPG